MRKQTKVIVFCGVVLFGIAGTVAGLLLLSPVLKFAVGGWGYNYFVRQWSELTGVNLYLLKALAVAVVCFLLWGLKMAVAPLNGRKRRTGWFVIAGSVVAYNLGFYFITAHQNFRGRDGEGMKWYTLTEAGVEYFDRPGVHPVYGVERQPVTPENASILKQYEGPLKRISPDEVALFDVNTGKPLATYVTTPEGAIEFFNRRGWHATFGVALQPVSHEIIKEWKALEFRPKPAGAAVETRRFAPVDSIIAEGKSSPSRTTPVLDWREIERQQRERIAAGQIPPLTVSISPIPGTDRMRLFLRNDSEKALQVYQMRKTIGGVVELTGFTKSLRPKEQESLSYSQKLAIGDSLEFFCDGFSEPRAAFCQ